MALGTRARQQEEGGGEGRGGGKKFLGKPSPSLSLSSDGTQFADLAPDLSKKELLKSFFLKAHINLLH